ncbi:MAG: hypothetical protein ACI4RH_07800, partial [Huintestinicola sp.]
MNGYKRRKYFRPFAAFTALIMTSGIFGGCAANSEMPEETSASESLVTEAKTDLTETASSSETTSVSEIRGIIPEQKGERIITSVMADSMVGHLISTDSSFTVTAAQDIPAESLKGMISLSSGSDFSLERTAPCSYKLKAAESFPENSMAVLTLNNSEGQTDYKWAFQTEGDVRVESTFPADGSEYADVYTGIEFTLTSRASALNAEEYFEIVPKISGYFTAY